MRRSGATTRYGLIDIAIRYLRLAVGATVSVIVAWSFLSAFPTAARDRQELTRAADCREPIRAQFLLLRSMLRKKAGMFSIAK
jgi:hypothetical protein